MASGESPSVEKGKLGQTLEPDMSMKSVVPQNRKEVLPELVISSHSDTICFLCSSAGHFIGFQLSVCLLFNRTSHGFFKIARENSSFAEEDFLISCSTHR